MTLLISQTSSEIGREYYQTTIKAYLDKLLGAALANSKQSKISQFYHAASPVARAFTQLLWPITLCLI